MTRIAQPACASLRRIVAWLWFGGSGLALGETAVQEFMCCCNGAQEEKNMRNFHTFFSFHHFS